MSQPDPTHDLDCLLGRLRSEGLFERLPVPMRLGRYLVVPESGEERHTLEIEFDFSEHPGTRLKVDPLPDEPFGHPYVCPMPHGGVTVYGASHAELLKNVERLFRDMPLRLVPLGS